MAGFVDEFAKLPIADRRPVDPEIGYGDLPRRSLFRIVPIRSHAKRAGLD
jgi:hypothetical protein